ncbi:MAG: preprotein translocase subunit TatC [Crenarchaeota archaeon]|nr:preprotein translocase subunit TatC [Thermoproteota archaeon]
MARPKLLDRLLSPFKCEVEEAERVEDVTYHLEELLKVIRRSIFAFFVALLIVVFFPINWITCPLFGLYCRPEDVAGTVGAQYIADLIRWLGYVPAMVALLRLITVAVTQMGVNPVICNAESLFNAYVMVIIWGALILAAPYIIYQFLCYLWPALYEHERRMIRNGLIATFGLFLLGELFAFTVVVPFGFELVVLFGQVAGAQSIWCLSDIINFAVVTAIITGLSFLLPIVVYYLVLVGLLRPEQLKGRNLRVAFVAIMFLAAVITPGGTGVSMLAIGIPMFILYYIAIVMAERALKEREARERAQL